MRERKRKRERERERARESALKWRGMRRIGISEFLLGTIEIQYQQNIDDHTT